MFIVFEGIEGCGKSTQARLLSEHLENRNVPHVLTREPGGTSIGEEVRRALLHGGDVPARTELLLMLAARAAFVDEIVRPALAKGQIVLSDRYELSSFAYQGFGRGLGLEAVKRANEFATGGLKANVTIVLDVPLERATERRAAAGVAADRIERAGDEFHREVARAYRLLAEEEPDVIALQGGDSPELVHAAVVRLLAERYPETFAAAQG
jgi:dTMP kinase